MVLHTRPKKLGSKGLGFNEIMAFAYILTIVFITISLIFLVRHSVNLFVDTSRTEADTYHNFILYAKEGLSYYDPAIDRVYPGIIDVQRFVPGTLESSLAFQDVHPSKELPAAKIELSDVTTGVQQELYWNEQWFLRLEPKSGLAGTGSPNAVKKSYPVVIKNGTDEHAGILTIEVIVPR